MQTLKKVSNFIHYAKSKTSSFCEYLSFIIWFPSRFGHWSPPLSDPPFISFCTTFNPSCPRKLNAQMTDRSQNYVVQESWISDRTTSSIGLFDTLWLFLWRINDTSANSFCRIAVSHTTLFHLLSSSVKCLCSPSLVGVAPVFQSSCSWQSIKFNIDSNVLDCKVLS